MVIVIRSCNKLYKRATGVIGCDEQETTNNPVGVQV